jgi:phenylalanyl-tRNA synthetase beta chain
MPLPDDAVIGESIATYLPEDAVLSLDITRNRGDVLSHFGLARDLHAAHAKKRLIPDLYNVSAEQPTPVTIADVHPDADSVSFGMVTFDEPKRTPLIIQSRLHLLGQKAINLPTDITNYLLLAYGQPLHAYDAQKLSEAHAFGIRRAHNAESFNGLNGKTYTLTPENLVITENDTAVAIAGILGGEATKVTDATTQVIFESAHFNPKAIHLGSKALNLSTESATRWERGVDPALQTAVLQHAQQMLVSLTQGTAFTPVTKTNKEPVAPTPIAVTTDTISSILGETVTPETLTTLLTALGFTFIQEANLAEATAPSWRPDIRAEEDLAEEVMRMIGLQHLPKKALAATVPQWKRSKWWRQEYLKDMLVALGGQEIMTYPFISDAEQAQFTPNKALPTVRVAPIEGKRLMRSTLLPSVLTTIGMNPETPFLVLFEVGKNYDTPEEITQLIIAVSGSQAGPVDAWWQNYFERLRLPVSSWMSRVMTVDADIAQQYKIRKPIVTVLELPISELLNQLNLDRINVTIPDIDTISYTPLSKYQMSRRDIAIVVSAAHDADAIAQSIRDLDPAIVDVTLFDIYRDPHKIGENKQSIAMHIGYQATDRTLTTDEINALHAQVENYLKEHYDASIR